MHWSVIIPTYNRSGQLFACLESIGQARASSLEVIVVDDGSSEPVAGLLKGKFPEVRVIRQPNSGPGSARNRGIEEARGEWIAFLDSDDLWFPWTLRTYEQVIESTHASILFGLPFRFRQEQELRDVQEAPGNWLLFEDYYRSGNEWRWWGASSFAFRREILNGKRFSSDPINGEDADFIMQMGHEHSLAQVTDPLTFAYREHEGNVTRIHEKTLGGVWNLVHSEKQGRYPGGSKRRRERRHILGRHIRPAILECLRHGPRHEGKALLRATLSWHLEDHRFRFLAAASALSIRP